MLFLFFLFFHLLLETNKSTLKMKKMVLFTYLFCLLLLCHATNNMSSEIPGYIHGPSNYSTFRQKYIFKEFIVVGFYSICAKSDNIDSEGLSHHAAVVDYFNDDPIQLHKSFSFLSYDVCNDTELARNLALSLILDQRFRVKDFEETPYKLICYKWGQ